MKYHTIYDKGKQQDLSSAHEKVLMKMFDMCNNSSYIKLIQLPK